MFRHFWFQTNDDFMKKLNRPVAWLIATHVVVGLVLGWLAGNTTPLEPVLWGVIFSQATLLGCWRGLDKNQRDVGCILVIAAVAYLGLMLNWIIGEPTLGPALCVCGSAFSVVVVFTVIQSKYARIVWLDDEKAKAYHEGFQFTIRQLMLLTLIVACGLTFGKPLYLSIHRILYGPVAFNLGFILIALVSVWAILRGSQPLFRSIVLLMIATTLGYFHTNAFPHLSQPFSITMFVSESISSLLSLWVVRRCGYRLVRLSRAVSKPMTTETPAN